MKKRRPPAQPGFPTGRVPSPASGERLQKVLAAAGIASRRECEQLIREGRVEVDRQVVTELGTRVVADQQEIRVDGEPIHRPKRLYYAVNKPPGVVCTNRDPAGRTRVVDLVVSDQRLFTVGRLDRASEGLIIVTNDGALADRLTHPRYGAEKTYLVRVAGHPTAAQLKTLREGIHLAEGLARVVSLRVKRRTKLSTDLEIVLNEGRNREIRRILARIGHKVLTLKRTSIGPLRLGKLPVGAARKLTAEEVRSLERCAGRSGTAAGDKRKRVRSTRRRRER
jgi:23S rRNA pseudouridine2605 synthase